MRVKHVGTITGRANADGRLEIVVQVTDTDIHDNQNGGWSKRDQSVDPWSFGLEFQLPVGELQTRRSPSHLHPPRATAT
jgi:hypothetical protein